MLRNRRRGEGFIQVAGCVNSQKTHLMYALGDGCEYRVIAFSSEEKAKKAYEEYRFLTEDVYVYPARDLLFYHADIKGKTADGQANGGAPGSDREGAGNTDYGDHYNGCFSGRPAGA